MTTTLCNYIDNDHADSAKATAPTKLVNSRTPTTGSHINSSREQTIGNKKYVVKSVFIGNQDIQTSLLNLAERKTVREMGLDVLPNTE